MFRLKSMKKKILLIIPPVFVNSALDFEIGFPVHLLFLGYSLKRVGWKIEYLDMTLEEKEGQDSFGTLEKHLNNWDIKLVGISNHTVRTSVTTRRVAEHIKSLLPEVKIVVGGVNATFMWRELLESCPDIDFVLRGYAQRGLLALASSLEKKSTPYIPGLVVREKNGYKVEPLQPIVAKDFPVPELEDLEYQRYLYWTKTYPLLTHSGCNFSCKFCTSIMPTLKKKNELFRNIDDIITELLKAIKLGFEKFFMTASNFAINKKWCLKFCNTLIKLGIPDKVTWFCMTRIDSVDKEILETLKKAGCIHISFGIEAFGTDQWDKMSKGNFSKDEIKKVFDLTKKLRISTSAFLILGAPDQTSLVVENTIKLLREIDPDYRVVSFFQPFPGTPYWGNPKKFGLSNIVSLDKWNFYEAPICQTKFLSKSELLNYMYKIYLDKGNGLLIEPEKDALEVCINPIPNFKDMPEPVKHAFRNLDGITPISKILDEIETIYSPRDRLITLYWLSVSIRKGVVGLSI